MCKVTNVVSVLIWLVIMRVLFHEVLYVSTALKKKSVLFLTILFLHESLYLNQLLYIIAITIKALSYHIISFRIPSS